MTCNLWFVLVAFDGATLDGRLYLLLKIVDGKSEKGTCYRTRNLFAPSRFIYFFADVPHFTKSTSNFLYYSVSRCCTRHRLNYRKNLFWQHIFQIYPGVLENISKILPKLTHDHFHRISFSATIVKHVVPILSTTKSVALSTFDAIYPDQKPQMPRNLIIMIAWLEFKEMFPTLRVIQANDSSGKKTMGQCYKW